MKSWPDLMRDSAHQRFRLQVRQLVSTYLSPRLDMLEQNDWKTRELFQTFGQAGLLSLTVPRTLGGADLDLTYSVVMAEEFMGAGAVGVASSLLVHGNTVLPLLAAGASPPVRDLYLEAGISGRKVGALAATEPESASVFTVRTTAREVGDDWVLDGRKWFITNGPIADFVLVVARTGPEPAPLGLTLVLVPAGTDGFSVENMDKLGLRSSPTGRLTFASCRVPKSCTVGPVGYGGLSVLRAIAAERILVGAGATALALACVSRTRAALTERLGPDDTLNPRSEGMLNAAPDGALNPSSLDAELADLWSGLQAGRAFAHRTAIRVAAGDVDQVQAAMAKFALVERAQHAIRRCQALLPWETLQDGGWWDRVLRDIPVLSIYAGSSETMRELVGNHALPRLLRTAGEEIVARAFGS